MVTLTLVEGGKVRVGSEGGPEDVRSFEEIPNPLPAEGGGHYPYEYLTAILVSELGGLLLRTDGLSVCGVVHHSGTRR